MGLLIWDESEQQGYGNWNLVENNVSLEFKIYELFTSDFAEIAPTIFTSRFQVSGMLFPFVKTSSDYDGLGFGSTPEARYKLGSFRYVNGYIITIVEGGIQTTPICSSSEFIIYPLQALKPSRFTVSYPLPDPTDYEVRFDAFPDGFGTGDVFDGRQIFPGFASSSSAAGFFISPNPSVVFDLSIFYVFDIANMSNTDPRDFAPFNF